MIAFIAIVGLIGYTLLRSKVGADVANRSNKSNEELSVGNFKDISKDILSYYSINPKDSFAFMSPLDRIKFWGSDHSAPIAFATELYHFHDNTTTKYSPYIFNYKMDK